MASRKINEIMHAITTKGFRKHNTHHKIYELYIDGKRTDISTYISHGPGSKQYGDKILQKMKKQLKVPNEQYLLQYIDCNKTEKEYIEYLTINKLYVFKKD